LWIEEYYHWSDKLHNFIPNNAAAD